jgi:hypothetical protein
LRRLWRRLSRRVRRWCSRCVCREFAESLRREGARKSEFAVRSCQHGSNVKLEHVCVRVDDADWSRVVTRVNCYAQCDRILMTRAYVLGDT